MAAEVVAVVPPREPPLGALAALRLAGGAAPRAEAVPAGAGAALVVAPGGGAAPVRLAGSGALRWAARQAAPAGAAHPLEDAGEGALGAAGVDSWVALASGDTLRPGAHFEAALAHVDAHLTLRSFVVGSQLSLADLALWGTLAVNQLWQQKLLKTGKFTHLARWFAHCSQLPELAATREAFPIFPPKKGGSGGGKGGKGTGGREGKKGKKDPDVAEIELKGAN